MPKRYVLKTRNIPIQQKRNSKFLGLKINENLSWKPYMTYILSEVRSELSIVKKIKLCLNTHSLLTLYHSFILSHILHCITLWYYGNKSVVGQLQSLVNNYQSWAFKKHTVERKHKFPNQNFLRLKRKRKFRNQNFFSLKRKREFRNQILKSLKCNCKFRNKNSVRFKAQTQIKNSTALLQIDCWRSAHKFRYLKKF